MATLSTQTLIAGLLAFGPLAFAPMPILAQTDLELIEREQAAFQKAASQASVFVVQIETFGGMERVDDELIAEGPTTGTILTEDGWILSSLFSFRQQPASILVNLPSGRRAPARIVARDYSRELALLKVDLEPDESLPHVPQPETVSDASLLPTLEWVGQWVIALGKTYDQDFVSQSTGIISAVGRAYDRAIQTDAKISPINYGGPLIDLRGRVLGILAPLSPGTFFDGDSSQIYDSGIGFAIPIRDIWERLPRMQRGEDIHPGKLGLVSQDQNELSGPVQVAGAVPGSPAAKAGLKAGDIVIEADGKPVALLADLRHALGPIDAGQPISLVVFRKGQRAELNCQLVKEIPIYRRRYLGLRLATSENNRLTITAIEADSPASVAALQIGQQIVECNGQPVANASEFRSQIAVAELDKPLELTVAEEEQKQDLKIQASLWPDTLPENLPKPRDIAANAQAKLVDVALGDVTNKAFAVIPPEVEVGALGLLIVYPEPGNLDRQRTLEHWKQFAAEYGWIVAVINSADSRRWSMDELELASRVLGRMQQSYAIDPARTVVAGLGVGGRMAMIAGSMHPEKISAVLCVGTQLPRFQVRRDNFPLQSVDYLFVGEEEQWKAPVNALREHGFSAIGIPAIVDAQNWETHPQLKIQSWLEGLARF